MRFPTNFDLCIVCMKESVGGWEHIIPASIGGRLLAKIVCDKCNHQRLGSKLVSQLKFDPTIRMALEYLKSDYPSLYKRLLKRGKFVGRGVDGSRVEAIEYKTGIKVISTSDAKGIHSHDTEEAKSIMSNMLEKSGYESEIIDLWIERFSSLSEDKPIQIPTGDIFIKRKMPDLVPRLSTELIEDRLPVLIAYEFLSLMIGNLIYDSAFDSVRECILTGEATSRITVERLRGKEYDVFHDIYIEPGEESFNVIIVLFRWIVFKVIFHGYNYLGTDSFYREQLDPQKSLFAITREDAREGRWLEA